jgi:anti-anti-sigma regulatory factor
MVQIAQSTGAEHTAIGCVAFDVERGPDWLLVRLGAPAAGISDWAGLADTLWSVLDQHFIYRLVLDCERAGLVDSTLMGQLVLLERRIRKQGGLLRLCSLSEASQQALHQCRLEGRLPHFDTRAEAILGHRPLQPR